MESGIVLLDSSVIIDFFRKPDKTHSFLFQITESYLFALSVITLFEFKIGLKTEKQSEEFQLLISPMDVLPVDQNCINEAVKIYIKLKQQNALIELADILIAATALWHAIPLATMNYKHFQRIPEIDLIRL